MDRVHALLFRPAVLDLGSAILLAGLSVIFGLGVITPVNANPKMVFAFGSVAAWHWHMLVWWLASASGLAALPLRRRFPIIVFAVTLLAAAVHSADVVFPRLPVDLALPIAVYTLAATTPRRLSLSALAAGPALAVLVPHLAPGSQTAPSFTETWLEQPQDLIVAGLVLAAAWFAGDGTRTRRAYLAEVERHARDLELERDRKAQLAAAAERSRLTRELHDVIAHALSVIVIQAQGGAAGLRGRHPEQTGEALEAIISTGRHALAETRHLLDVVRRTPQDGLELAPQPDLRRLGELIEQVRRSGTPVELDTCGTPRPLPAVVAVSAYRIVQEALTNIMKHAGPGASATVLIHYGGDAVSLEVTDNGRGAQADGRTGHGLRGMRERAAALGGEATAGTIPSGGFRVRALLPLTTDPPSYVRDSSESSRRTP